MCFWLFFKSNQEEKWACKVIFYRKPLNVYTCCIFDSFQKLSLWHLTWRIKNKSWFSSLSCLINFIPHSRPAGRWKSAWHLWNLSLLCVLSIWEVSFYQRLEACVSPLAHVEHEDKEEQQETDEDPAQSGAQHHHSRPTGCICEDEGEAIRKGLKPIIRVIYCRL